LEKKSLSRPLDAHEGTIVGQVAWLSFASLDLLPSCDKVSVLAKASYWAWISPITIQ